MFPPAGPVTIQNTIPSYLYTGFQDDDDLQAFVSAYNEMAQEYVTQFNALGLPVYTGLTGPLLDWVGLGLYGMLRPALSSGVTPDLGPFNTLTLNSEEFNYFFSAPVPAYTGTSDNDFKRILTWAFYKGDGRQFDVRWLKRRVVRFILGVNGEDADTANTYDVSVSIAGAAVTITIAGDLADNPSSLTFQQAVQSGALELPFQYSFTVVI